MAAAAGDNSKQTPEERKAIFMNHYRPIADQLAVVKEAQAEYKRLRKLAKADQIVLADIDFAIRCAEIDDSDIIVDTLKRQAEIAAWFALPVEYQANMFGHFDREPGVDRARREGQKAGATGVGGNPYDENSKPGRAWADAWREEQAKLAEALVTAMEKRNAAKDGGDEAPVEAAPKKRGRPRKAAGDKPNGETPPDPATAEQEAERAAAAMH